MTAAITPNLAMRPDRNGSQTDPAPSSSIDLPLTGIRVADFSHVYQGPVATQLLADYGADVIKIERPTSGDWSRAWGPFVKGVSLPFANLNRNKRSLSVDLKQDAGRRIVQDLVESSDVLVHNFRMGVMEKLGLGYEQLSEINPGLIYASSSGWGDEGPCVDRKRGGHDMMARAEAGWFVEMGEGQAPVPGGISADYPAGLNLAIGILMALQHRNRTGRGQQVTTDLLSVAMHAHAWEGATQLNENLVDEPARVGGTEAAIDKAFLTADGAIEISPVFSENALAEISVALGLGDLSQDDRFGTETLQIENREALNALLANAIRRKTTDEWIRRLEPAGVFCAEVRSFAKAAEDPQVHANGMIHTMRHPRAGGLRVLGNPIRLHGATGRPKRHAPDLGEDSRGVVRQLGRTVRDVNKLEADGVIHQADTP